MKKLFQIAILLLLPFVVPMISSAEELSSSCFSSFNKITTDNVEVYESSCGEYKVEFRSDRSGYVLSNDSVSLGISYQGSINFLSESSQSQLTYLTLLDKDWINIIYDLKPSMIKEDIVLKSKPDLMFLEGQEYFSIPLKYDLKGLNVFVVEDKVSFINDKTTNVDLYFPALTITDNTGNSGKIKFGHNENSQQILIKVDKKYLENAVYPVVIDPTVVINPTSDTTTATQPSLMRHVVMTSEGSTHTFVQIGTQTATCGGSPLSGLLWFSTSDGVTWTCQGQLSSDTTNKFYAAAVHDNNDNIYVVYSVLDNTANAAYDVYYRKLTKGIGSNWTLGSASLVADGNGTSHSYSYATIALEGTTTAWVSFRWFNGTAYQSLINYSSDLSSTPIWTSDIKTVIDKFWIFTVAGGIYTDETSDANSPTSADVTLPSAIGDIYYAGSTEPFYGLNWILSTFGTTGGGVYEYWDGTTWSALTPFYLRIYNNLSSETNGGITFVRPSNWMATSVNGEGSSYYYVRYRVTTAYVTLPVGSFFSFGLNEATEQTTNAIGTLVKYKNRLAFMSYNTRGTPYSGSLSYFHYRNDGDPHNSWYYADWRDIVSFNQYGSYASDEKGYIYGFYGGSINYYDGIHPRRSTSNMVDDGGFSTTDGTNMSTDGSSSWFFFKDSNFPDTYVYRRGWFPFDSWTRYFTGDENMADVDRYSTVIGGLKKLWTYNTGVYTDETTSSQKLDASDVALMQTSGDYVYFGDTAPFSALTWYNGTVGAGGSVNWQYWNGSIWNTLSLSGSANANFTTTLGYVQFTAPGDWAQTAVNGEPGGYYYIRAGVNVNYSTRPLMTAVSTAREVKYVSAPEHPINNKLTVVWTQDNTTPSAIRSEVLDINMAPTPAATSYLTSTFSYNFDDNPEYHSFSPTGKSLVRTSDGTLHYVYNATGYRSRCNNIDVPGLIYYTSSDNGATWTCKQVLNELIGYSGWIAPIVIPSLIKDAQDNLYFVYTFKRTTPTATLPADLYYHKFTKGVGSTWTVGPMRTVAAGIVNVRGYSGADIDIDTTNNRLMIATKVYDSQKIRERVAVFYSSNMSDNPVWTESPADSSVDKYWSYVSGVYLDDTIDAGSITTGDTQVAAAIGDIAYFGESRVFNHLAFDFSNTPTSGLVIWEYWNGSTWIELRVDNAYPIGSANLRSDGSIVFNLPDDWAMTSINGEAQSYYYVRARVTTNFVTVPNGSIFQIGISQHSTLSSTVYPTMFRYGGNRTGIIYMGPQLYDPYYMISRADSDPDDYWTQPVQITEEKGFNWTDYPKIDAVGTDSGEIFFVYQDQQDSREIKFMHFDGVNWSNSITIFESSDIYYTFSNPEEVGDPQVLTDGTNVWVIAGDAAGLTTSVKTNYEPLVVLDKLSVRKGSPPFGPANFSAAEPLLDSFGFFDKAWMYDSVSDTYSDETAAMADSDVPEKVWRNTNSIYQDVTSSFADNDLPYFDKVWEYVTGKYSDDTYYAYDGSFRLGSQPGDGIYIGEREKFNSLAWKMTTLGVGGSVVWEYWNGASWSALTLIDSQNPNFTGNGYGTFAPPADWQTMKLDTGNNLVPGMGPPDLNPYYYIRARVTGVYSTAPVGRSLNLDFALAKTGDAIYIGHSEPFNRLTYDLMINGAGGTAIWEYWNGSTWTALTFLRNYGDQFTSYNSELFYTPPGDWTTLNINGEATAYYYIRARATLNYTTLPTINQFGLGSDVTPIIDVNDALYFGDTTKFDAVAWDMINQVTAENENSLGGWGGGVIWEYWNGSAWRSIVNFVDRAGQSFFTWYQEGYLQFKVPADWALLSINGEATPHYYVRARVLKAYLEPPLFLQAVHIPITYVPQVAMEINNNTAYVVWWEGYSEGNLADPNYSLARMKFSTFNVDTSAPSNNTPAVPSNPRQYKADGITIIPPGGTNNSPGGMKVKFEASDTDNPEQLTPQVEIKVVGAPFTNNPTHSGATVTFTGSPLTITVDLPDVANGNHHWQARTCDDQGACSSWVSYGGNPESEPDVIIDVQPNNTPNVPANPKQYKSDGVTEIPKGGTNHEQHTKVKFTVSDPDLPENLTPEVEIKQVGAPFANVPTHAGATVTFSGSPVTVTVDLPAVAEGSHHWQSRVCDDDGACSTWVSYGDNPESEPDLIVDVPVCGNNILEYGESCDSSQLNGQSCSNFSGYSGGSLSCSASCTFNLSACTRTVVPQQLTPTPEPVLEIINVTTQTNVDEVDICWDTNIESTGYVRYGIGTLVYSTSESLEPQLTNHCVNIPNLEINTIYNYTIIANAGDLSDEFDSEVLSATYASTFSTSTLPLTGDMSCGINLNRDYTRDGSNVAFSFTTDNTTNCSLIYGMTESNLPYSGSLSRNGNLFSALIDPARINYDNGFYRVSCTIGSNNCSATDRIPEFPLQESAFMITSETMTVISLIALLLLILPRMIAFPEFWLYAFAWAFLRRKFQPWGIIYDLKTKKPVPFAVARIYDSLGKMLKQTVSDLEGKFGFILDRGSYSLNIEHSSYLKVQRDLEIRDKEIQYAEDIGLTQSETLSMWQNVRIFMDKFSRRTFNVIWVIGFVACTLATVTNPVLLNLAIMVMYLAQAFILFILKPARNWGVVYEVPSDLGLEGAFIRVQDIAQGRQIEVQMSDAKGRFGFKLDKGEYLLLPSYDNYKVIESELPEQRLADGSLGYKYKTDGKHADFGMNR